MALIAFVLLLIATAIFVFDFIQTRNLGSLGLALVTSALTLLNLPA